MNKSVMLVCAMIFGLTLAGCGNQSAESNQKVTELSQKYDALKSKVDPLIEQARVRSVQATAKGVAKAVVVENHVRQLSICGEIPARLTQINDYNVYRSVANDQYVQTCRAKVVAANDRDHQRKLAAMAKHTKLAHKG